MVTKDKLDDLERQINELPKSSGQLNLVMILRLIRIVDDLNTRLTKLETDVRVIEVMK